jgi:hypothetical protein
MKEESRSEMAASRLSDNRFLASFFRQHLLTTALNLPVRRRHTAVQARPG